MHFRFCIGYCFLYHIVLDCYIKQTNVPTLRVHVRTSACARVMGCSYLDKLGSPKKAKKFQKVQ